MTAFEFLYVGAWIVLLAETIMTVSAINDTAWLLRRVHESEASVQGDWPIEIGDRMRFSGCLSDAPGTAVTEHIFEGFPSTFVFVSPRGFRSKEELCRLAGLVSALRRRAFERLWVFCDGLDTECLELQKILRDSSSSRSFVISRLTGALTSLFHSDGTVTIVNTDSDACVLTYGRSAKKHSNEDTKGVSDG